MLRKFTRQITMLAALSAVSILAGCAAPSSSMQQSASTPPTSSIPVFSADIPAQTRQHHKEATRAFCQGMGKALREMKEKSDTGEQFRSPEEMLSALRAASGSLRNVANKIQKLPTTDVDNDVLDVAAGEVEQLNDMGAMYEEMADFVRVAKTDAAYNRSPEATVEFLGDFLMEKEPYVINEQFDEEKGFRYRREAISKQTQMLQAKSMTHRTKILAVTERLKERYGEDEDMLPKELIR